MTTKPSFHDELCERILIGDGAVGSELFARGAQVERGVERLNILDPDAVLRLHEDYVAAGSQVIETNTFAANRPSLARYDEDGKIREIILAGTKLARQAAGTSVYVAGSVGPLSPIEGEPIDPADQTAYFAEQIGLLIEGGVDLLIFESFGSIDELVRALYVAKSMTQLPIIAQMAFGTGGRTSNGDTAIDMAHRCTALGVEAIGANCGYGVSSVADAIEQMAAVRYPMSAYVNAGFPEHIDGRMMYPTSDDYLVKRSCDLVDLGVRLVGGCCGTNPTFIHSLAEAVAEKSPTRCVVAARPAAVVQATPKARKRPTTAQGRILVELDPPTEPNLSPIIAAARQIREAGADAITVADNPLATIRVDTLTVASNIQSHAGIPVIPHLTGRDRNRIALQSTIMGAHVLGIRSLLCVTGDPVRMCEDPNTSGVFDVNSIGLIQMVSRFNANHAADNGSGISIGVALNPNVRMISKQVARLKRKVEAGAGFALTQPIYSEEHFQALQDALAEAGVEIPIYIGILPLTSARNAEFLHNEVPGMIIPDAVRERLASYEKVADQRAAGIEVCAGIMSHIGTNAAGFYIMTPRNRVELVLPLIDAVD